MEALQLVAWKQPPDGRDVPVPERGPGQVLVRIGGGSFPFGFFSVPYEVSLASTYWGSLPELVEVLELARLGHLRAHAERYPLADAPRAHEALTAAGISGRALIVPEP